jgi:hypothetical protein
MPAMPMSDKARSQNTPVRGRDGAPPETYQTCARSIRHTLAGHPVLVGEARQVIGR